MKMTDSEAIEILKYYDEQPYFFSKDASADWAFKMAISAFEEVQQYRAIGTAEELKTATKYVSLAKKHGTVGKAIDACAEYEAIGTASEFRELKEKATAKAPVPVFNGFPGFCLCSEIACPHCTEKMSYLFKNNYCPKCGQKLLWDWSEGKE